MTTLTFLHLNPDWNAEPNDPDPKVAVDGSTLRLMFFLNPFAYTADEGEIGIITFQECSRWRRDTTNDQGWYSGKGRFAREAPAWGEFYEVVGEDRTSGCEEWQISSPDPEGAKHFIFYFRDEAVECVATDWALERKPSSAISAASEE